MRIENLNVSLDCTSEDIMLLACAKAKIKPNSVNNFRIVKKSVDARKKSDVHFVCSVALDEDVPSLVFPQAKNVTSSPVVIGSGPAGLFCAYYLAKGGARPIVLERGASVDKRQLKVNAFLSGGALDTETNVQFGEGGAGTFSDGKLTTLISSPYRDTVLRIFTSFGAPQDILYSYKPHIGTDMLVDVIKNMREEIISLGGKFLFETKATDLLCKNGKVYGVKTNRGDFLSDRVILAIGHSARDTYEMLFNEGVELSQKDFSIGFRIEHLQEEINLCRFGEKFATHPALGAADYKLVSHTPHGSVYTFCMCPGGRVISACSEKNRLVTNGMSFRARNGENANSALLYGVKSSSFGDSHPLAGIALQRKYEEKAYTLGGENYYAPIQYVGDFLDDTRGNETGKVAPTYAPGVCQTDLRGFFGENATAAFRCAIKSMTREISCFSNGLLTAVESRSSAPVRINRNEAYQSVSHASLYPIGEGAGYAGGIVSSAIDGIKCAIQILSED